MNLLLMWICKNLLLMWHGDIFRCSKTFILYVIVVVWFVGANDQYRGGWIDYMGTMKTLKITKIDW